MRSARRLAAFPLLTALLALGACGDDGAEGRRILLNQLADREEYWAANGSANYTFQITRDCFCNDDSRKWEVELEVVNNEIVAGEHVFSNVALTQAELNQQLTITDVFDVVRDALNRGAAQINIAYNVNYGYVEELYINFDARRSDDDVIIVVNGYTPQSAT